VSTNETLIVVAVIAGLPATLATLLQWWSQTYRFQRVEKQVAEVHEIANDRLTKALDRIELLALLVQELQTKLKEES
jgi:Mn-containing catalase